MATIPRQQKVLLRSRSNKILGGVCAGLAVYFGIDPLLVRLLFVVVAMSAGIGLLLYAVLWLVVPMEPETTTPTVDAMRR